MKVVELPKEYFNLFGIYFIVTGNLFVGRDFIQDARQLVQAIERENVYGMMQMWKTKHIPSGGFIHATLSFGTRSAYIYVPSALKEVNEKEEEERNTWRFVPGIAIKNFDNMIFYDCYIYSFELTGNMSVCDNMNWEGVLYRIVKNEEPAYPRYPGESYINVYNALVDEGLTTERVVDIIACDNWAYRDWRFTGITDTFETKTIAETDTGFQPGPYGYYPPWGFPNIESYAFTILNATKTVYLTDSWGYGTEQMGDALYACINRTWPGTSCFGCGTTYFFWDTSEQSNPVYCDFPVVCYQDTVGYTLLQSAIITNSGLWDSIIVRAMYETTTTVCHECWVTCICDPKTWSYHDLGVVFEATLGGPQTRSAYSESNQLWHYESVEVIDRASGNVTFSYDYRNYVKEHSAYAIPDICSSNQTDTYTFRYNIGVQRGFDGGYIQDSCPLDNFKDLYFIVYVEDWENEDHVTTDDQIHLDSAYGYNSDGVWSDGIPAGIPGPYDYEVEEKGIRLFADVNGVRVDLDSAVHNDYEHWEFKVIDSYIFNALGTPVYMYAYVKFKTDYDAEGDGVDNAVYTKYGYFYGSADKHYQSQEFYPAGVMNNYDPTDYGVMNLHDVFGSAEKGLYGWGQCCGFLVNERTKEIRELSR